MDDRQQEPTPECRSPNCDPDECARGCWMKGSTIEASDMPEIRSAKLEQPHVPSRAVPDEEPTLDGEASELAEARATIRRLNRRCQSAERGLAEKLEDAKRSGGSLGRGLANSAAVLYRDRLADAERERDQWREAAETTLACFEAKIGRLEEQLSRERVAIADESNACSTCGDDGRGRVCSNGWHLDELSALRSESEAVKAERATAIEAMLKTLHESSSDYEAALESARSESEALRRDKERLDWYEANPKHTGLYAIAVDGKAWWRSPHTIGHTSLRGAIDAAMASHPTPSSVVKDMSSGELRRSTLGIEGTNT